MYRPSRDIAYVKPGQTISAHILKITLSVETGAAVLPIVDLITVPK
jgi:hypothetical protein